MHRLQSSLVFLVGCVIGGLALSFLIVVWRPQLLGTRGAEAPAAAAAAPAASVAPSPGAAPAILPSDAPAASAPTVSAAPPAPATSVADVDPHAGSYSPAVRRAAPAVVNIYTARVVTERVPRTVFEDPFGELGPRYRQRVERSLGSGVILDTGGHIVTNHHVIADAESVRVQLADGRVADATIVGRDPDTDLAVLHVALPNLPTMPLGRSDQLDVGDIVLAIGNPIGLSQTVTQGIVSATGRGQLGVATFENFIQTDAPINVGNSGGALINVRGELVGINTAVIAKNLGVEGIGFAIPVNLVRGVIQDIIGKGRVVRGWIGIVPEDVEAEQARGLGLARGGVVVTDLFVGSPALAAGLRPGDLLDAVDGKPVATAQEALARIARLSPGATVKVTVQRGTQVAEVSMKVVERPRSK
jgi:serine peptidase DegS